MKSLKQLEQECFQATMYADDKPIITVYQQRFDEMVKKDKPKGTKEQRILCHLSKL